MLSWLLYKSYCYHNIRLWKFNIWKQVRYISRRSETIAQPQNIRYLLPFLTAYPLCTWIFAKR